MENYTPRLKERYRSEIAPALMERFELTNPMEVPRLVKAVVNKGIGEASQNKKILDDAMEELRKITGQQPSVRNARQSISNFKLRSDRMWEFVDRLITLALPRVRDFRGVPDRSFDGRGNYTLGVKEQIIFPEIDIESVSRVSGLDITFVTTADTDEMAHALLKEFGMPFVRRETVEA
jgi:large subunit ribosomal protein L5